MARKTCYLLISVILINCIFCGSAAAPDNNNLNSYDLELQWDKDAQPPFVRIFFNTGKPPELMLPLRYLVESSGGVVEWNSSLKTAVINKKALVVTGDFYDVIGTGTGTSALLGQVKEPDHDILRGIMKNGTLFVSARELNNQIKVAEISLDYEVPDNHFSYAYWPPVEGPVSSPFGLRLSPFGGGNTQFHNGIDIAADFYAPIRSVSHGTVKAGSDDGWGNYVIVRDAEYECHYYHMSSLEVSTGQVVEPGQVLGYVGSTGASTGPHLHFSIKRCFDPSLIHKD